MAYNAQNTLLTYLSTAWHLRNGCKQRRRRQNLWPRGYYRLRISLTGFLDLYEVPELPIEIRLVIWEFAMEPRTLAINFNFHPNTLNNPKLLFVNRESRKMIRKKYIDLGPQFTAALFQQKLISDPSRHLFGFYINPSKDIITMDLCALPPWVLSKIPSSSFFTSFIFTSGFVSQIMNLEIRVSPNITLRHQRPLKDKLMQKLANFRGLKELSIVVKRSLPLLERPQGLSYAVFGHQWKGNWYGNGKQSECMAGWIPARLTLKVKVGQHWAYGRWSLCYRLLAD